MSENKDNGGPAYPVEVDPTQPDGRQTGNTVFQSYGMSLRDYFAAKAMQAAATNPVGAEGFTFEERAAWAYAQADAMLEARK